MTLTFQEDSFTKETLYEKIRSAGLSCDDVVSFEGVVDFHNILAGVEEGIFDTVEEALHEKLVGIGEPLAPFFEFISVEGPTRLKIWYATSVKGLFTGL